MTVVSGAYLLLNRLDAGLFGYAAMGLVVSLAAYFCIELYQKSKA